MRQPGHQRKIKALGLLRNTGYGLSCKTSVTCKKTSFQLISTYLREELRIFPCITPLMLTWSWRHILIVWERITGQKLFVSKREQNAIPKRQRQEMHSEGFTPRLPNPVLQQNSKTCQLLQILGQCADKWPWRWDGFKHYLDLLYISCSPEIH